MSSMTYPAQPLETINRDLRDLLDKLINFVNALFDGKIRWDDLVSINRELREIPDSRFKLFDLIERILETKMGYQGYTISFNEDIIDDEQFDAYPNPYLRINKEERIGGERHFIMNVVWPQ